MAKSKGNNNDAQWMQSLRDAGIVRTPVPEPKYPEVELYTDLTWAMTAFWRLSAVRPQSMDGAVRIPISEIAAYAAIHRFDRRQSLQLLAYIDAMDAAYMGFLREQREEEEGKRAARSAPTVNKRAAPKR